MTFNLRQSVALAAIACAGFGMTSMAEAKTFKWANSGDVSSMDPYARQETFLLTFTSNIYDPLIRRDKNLKLEPAGGERQVVRLPPARCSGRWGWT